MFDSIKTQLWDLLKEKQVSLVMIFDRHGKILWHRGREVEGKSVEMGVGFPTSFARKIIKKGDMIKKENVELMVFGSDLSESARSLCIKSLIIIPIKNSYFLYVDSGTREYFSEADIEVFKVMGGLLGRMIERIRDCEDCRDGIEGSSQQIKKIRDMVIKYSLEEDPVLLIGETGVGKSHIADLIHRYSGRTGSLEVAEITSINESLFESTMFGHRKGSFTDAKENKIGLVQEADKGTLFIDEISEIPISFQAKLLRFIDKKRYRVIGESKEREADVRIVAATNRDLQKAIRNKEFREDLYYRLHVLEIEIPPLRERKEDIKDFIKKNRRYLKGKEIGDGFWEAIMAYDWPGNMRELITVLKRAGILLEGPITGEKLEKVICGRQYKKNPSQGGDDEAVEEIWSELERGKSFWEVIKAPYLNRDLNRKQVKAIIARALPMARGTYKEMLPMLNIQPNHYAKFMKFLYRNRLM